MWSFLSDATDPRPWQERLDDAFRHVEADSVVAGLEDIAASRTQAAVDTWVRKVRTVGYKAFARRLLGAATYDQLERALYEHAAVARSSQFAHQRFTDPGQLTQRP